MEAILQLPPGLPQHDAAPLEAVPARVLTEWPRGTFIENLAVLPGGDVIVSVMSEARLDRVTTAGAVSAFHQFDRPPTGLALAGRHLFVAVGEPGKGAPDLWRIDPATGAAERWLTLGGVSFANGVTPFAPGILLIAESWQGRLVRVDLDTRIAVTWFEDERLTRAPAIDGLPGANGVKRFGGEVTISSNGRALLMRVAVRPDGSAGDAAIIAERLRADDFAYDLAGRLYLATHVGHSLDRLDRNGRRVSLGGPDQGLAGSTACAFHADGGLYVTTTGGIITPPGGALQPARLVRLDVNVAGHRLDSAWDVRA